MPRATTSRACWSESCWPGPGSRRPLRLVRAASARRRSAGSPSPRSRCSAVLLAFHWRSRIAADRAARGARRPRRDRAPGAPRSSLDYDASMTFLYEAELGAPRAGSARRNAAVDSSVSGCGTCHRRRSGSPSASTTCAATSTSDLPFRLAAEPGASTSAGAAALRLRAARRSGAIRLAAARARLRRRRATGWSARGRRPRRSDHAARRSPALERALLVGRARAQRASFPTPSRGCASPALRSPAATALRVGDTTRRWERRTRPAPCG